MAVNITGGDSLKYVADIDTDPLVRATGRMEKAINEASKAGISGGKKQNEEITKQIKSIQSLEIKMQSYKAVSEKATDPKVLQQYNKEIQNLEKEIDRLGNVGKEGFDSMGNAVDKTEKKTGGLMNTIKAGIASLAAYFTIDALISFGKQVLNITAEFQKLNAVLGNTLGSKSLANLAMQGIVDFAEKTPFSVNELTASFVKLANQGFVPTGAEMRKLGDLASSTGKGFDQLSEAILDAMAGENERLKEFGIKAKVNGDLVTYTFKGVATTVNNTADAVRNYVTSLGDIEGVAGSMAVISETLTGKISNLGDTWDQMLVSVGSNTDGAFAGAIEIMSAAVKKVTQFNNEINKVNKYKLGNNVSEFFTKMNRAVNPFASKGATKIELEVAGIDNSNERVSKFVAQSIEGAKSAKDFSDSIYSLNEDMKKVIAVPGLSVAEVKGVTAQYIEGAKTLKDAAKNFLAKRDNPSVLSPAQIKAAEAYRKKVQAEQDQDIKQEESFQRQFADMKDRGAIASMTKDEAAIEALRVQFKGLAYDIGQANLSRKTKIELPGLDVEMQKQITDLRYRQDTEKLKIKLDADKELYADFEQYKVDFGEEAAKKKYSNELDTSKTFLQKLQAEYALVMAQGMANGFDAKIQERLAPLLKSINAVTDAQEQSNNKIKAGLLDYNQQKVLITEKYNAKAIALGKGMTEAQSAQLLDQRNEEYKAIDETNAVKLTKFYKGMDQMLDYSKKSIKAQIQSVKDLLAGSDLSADIKMQLEAELKSLQIALKAGEDASNATATSSQKSKLLIELDELIYAGLTNTEQFKKLRAELDLLNKQSDETAKKGLKKLYDTLDFAFQTAGRLGESLTNLGDALGNDGLKSGGDLLSGIASQAQGIMTAFNPDANDFDKVAAGIQGLLTIVDTIVSASAERKRVLEEYYRSVIGLQNDYNMSLNDQIRLQSILEEGVFLKDYTGRIGDGIKAATDASKKMNEAIAKLDQGQAITGKRNAVDWGKVGKTTGAGAAAGAAIGSIVPVIGTAIGAVVGGITGFFAGLFGGKKKVDTYMPVLKEYPELIQKMQDGTARFNSELAKSLVSNNLVDEATKSILNNIIEWQAKLDEAREQIKGVVSELAGGLGNDLRNSLVEAFKAGTDAAVAFGDSVGKVLENIVSNLLFNAVFADAFKKLEADMIASFDPLMGDGNLIDDFGKFFEGAPGLIEKFNAGMTGAKDAASKVGLNIFKNPTATVAGAGGNTLSGAVKGITETQADLLAGQFGGLRITAIAQLNIATRSLEVHVQNELNTRRLHEVVPLLKSMNDKLDKGSTILAANGR